ncbi:uncharacterized protein LOC141535264 [Cotesia typhae]|uniref:uncharacterized protein LOC141526581 n=1 Tax=Cotesia typhae TaxID=2053667 RepID=UPI003D687416
MCYPKMKEVILKDESGILPIIEVREEDLMAFRTFWPHDPLFQILSRSLDEETVVWLSLCTRLVRRPSTFLQFFENLSQDIFESAMRSAPELVQQALIPHRNMSMSSSGSVSNSSSSGCGGSTTGSSSRD